MSVFAHPRRSVCAAGLAVAGLIAACTPGKSLVIDHEDFGSTTIHSRAFAGPPAQVCEAARRALLSQGYIVNSASADLVVARKNFQPNNDVHIEIDFRVVCAREGQGSPSAIAFASALQDRFSMKKINNSASVGVGALGSLSLPFSSSDDAMVRVASQTITDPTLYGNFFKLLQRYLEDALQASEREDAAAEPASTPPPPAGVPRGVSLPPAVPATLPPAALPAPGGSAASAASAPASAPASPPAALPPATPGSAPAPAVPPPPAAAS